MGWLEGWVGLGERCSFFSSLPRLRAAGVTQVFQPADGPKARLEADLEVCVTTEAARNISSLFFLLLFLHGLMAKGEERGKRKNKEERMAGLSGCGQSNFKISPKSFPTPSSLFRLPTGFRKCPPSRSATTLRRI
jgi:hypothetical protein